MEKNQTNKVLERNTDSGKKKKIQIQVNVTHFYCSGFRHRAQDSRHAVRSGTIRERELTDLCTLPVSGGFLEDFFVQAGKPFLK